MPQETVTVTIHRKGSVCFIPVNFDPKTVFGKIRAPVKVTLNGYTYRSTVASMGGFTVIPLRRSNREAAGLVGGESIAVTIELDAEPREVELPDDLARALSSKTARLIAQLYEAARNGRGDRERQETCNAGAPLEQHHPVSG